MKMNIFIFTLLLYVNANQNGNNENDSSSTKLYSCGTDCHFQFEISSRTLRIGGNGTMDNYQSKDDIPWKNITKIIRYIIIDEIQNISEFAFYSINQYATIEYTSTSPPECLSNV